MPTIEVSLTDLWSLLGRKLSLAELEDNLQFAKATLEGVNGDTAKIEISDTNRPDLWSTEGLARELQGALRIEKGIPILNVGKSKVVVKVEKKVATVRPLIVAAIVKGVKLNERAIEQLIQLQEKVALTCGRRRAQAGIGVYDFDKIKSPIRYTTVKPDSIKFVPLDFDKQMTPAEILKKHPKGQEYGSLLAGAKEFPILIDAAANVLSMPPIINSETVGKVTTKSRNLFIEVTGTDIKILNTALNVMVAALAARGGKIESVVLEYQKKVVTPDLIPKQFAIDPEEVRQLLGLKISDMEIIKLLQEARYDARKIGKKIAVRYPAYRSDIMHARDVIEDVAISFGYNDFEPALLKLVTIGSSDPLENFSDKIREAMVGFGLQEVMTFTLTNYDTLYKLVGCDEGGEERGAEIANPVSERFTVLRNWMIPSLIEFLSKNTHVDYPQKIFEVGDVVWIDGKEETKTKNVRTLAVALASADANFAQAKSILDALLASLGKKSTIKIMACGTFIDGRVGEVIVDGESIGFIGEINPKVLNAFKIEVPIAAFEIRLDRLLSINSIRP